MQFDQLKRREFITLLGGAAVEFVICATHYCSAAQQSPATSRCAIFHWREWEAMGNETA
jgi:hypothetical protein